MPQADPLDDDAMAARTAAAALAAEELLQAEEREKASSPTKSKSKKKKAKDKATPSEGELADAPPPLAGNLKPKDRVYYVGFDFEDRGVLHGCDGEVFGPLMKMTPTITSSCSSPTRTLTTTSAS